MSTHVHNSYKATLLTIPSVRVRVHVQAMPTVLREDGYMEFYPRVMLPGSQEARATCESFEKRLARRNWRTIRNTLVNLDLENASAVCEWLGSAGYVPQAILTDQMAGLFSDEDLLRVSVGSFGWEVHHLTDNIRAFVKKSRDLVFRLMTLDKKAFARAIRSAHEFAEDQVEADRVRHYAMLNNRRRLPNLKDPGVVFSRDVRAPEGIDPMALGLALRGSGTSESLVAQLRWDHDGSPTVMVFPRNPVEAICLSIHIDRDFSRRRFVSCECCGKWLEQIRGRDRFCSAGCRNYMTTTERRAKLRLLIEAQALWEALSKKKGAQNRWDWIAAVARRKSKGKFAIEPSWAKQELTKLKRRKRKKTRRQAVEGEEVENRFPKAR